MLQRNVFVTFDSDTPARTYIREPLLNALREVAVAVWTMESALHSPVLLEAKARALREGFRLVVQQVRRHLAGEKPRSDAVDIDALRREIGAEVARQLVYSRLTGRVCIVGHMGMGDAVNGTDIDHPGGVLCTTGGTQLGQELLQNRSLVQTTQVVLILDKLCRVCAVTAAMSFSSLHCILLILVMGAGVVRCD